MFASSIGGSTTSQELIINAVGNDRLGIVSDMTKYVIDVGGNVGESQAAKLGNHFSLMMLVTVPENKVTDLEEQLSTMTDMNATIHIIDDTQAAAAAATPMSPLIGCKYTKPGV